MRSCSDWTFHVEYVNVAVVGTSSVISNTAVSNPSYTTCVDGKIILQWSGVCLIIFLVPLIPISIISFSLSHPSCCFVYATSVIHAKWCTISASHSIFCINVSSMISHWMKSIPQSLNSLTLSDINLLSTTRIFLNLDSPEYNLDSSVPIYPRPPVITIFCICTISWK